MTDMEYIKRDIYLQKLIGHQRKKQKCAYSQWWLLLWSADLRVFYRWRLNQCLRHYHPRLEEGRTSGHCQGNAWTLLRLQVQRNRTSGLQAHFQRGVQPYQGQHLPELSGWISQIIYISLLFHQEIWSEFFHSSLQCCCYFPSQRRLSQINTFSAKSYQ